VRGGHVDHEPRWSTLIACHGGRNRQPSVIDAQALVLITLPSPLPMAWSAELTPLEAMSRLAINSPLPEKDATLARAESTPVVSRAVNKAAPWLPLMLLIDMATLLWKFVHSDGGPSLPEDKQAHAFVLT
jgi:hypothetical protein